VAIDNSHPNHISHQSATRRRVNSRPLAHMEQFSPEEKALPASPPEGSSLATASTDRTNTHTPVPLSRELASSAGTGQLPELLTLLEVCAFLKVKPSYIYSLTATDRIPHRKFGGTLRFVKTEILQWIDRGRRGPRMSEPPRSDS
jgi:excisionase family DNA binding protein